MKLFLLISFMKLFDFSSLDPASWINKAVDFGFGLISHDKQKDTSKDLMNWQNENAVKFWNMQNEYNLPVNQMKRLKDAGINPNLAYSNGQLSNVSAQSPISASANGVNPPSVGNSLYEYQLAYENIKTAREQQNLLQSQANAQEAKAELDRANAIKTASETTGINFWNTLNDENRKYHKERPALDNELVASQILNSTYDSMLKQQQSALAHSAELLNQQQIQNLKKQLSLIDSQIQSTQAQTTLYNKQALHEHEKTITTKLENALKKVGIYPNDPLYSRIIGMYKTSPEKGISLAIGAIELAEKANHNLNVMSNTYQNVVPSTINALKPWK